ncbi:hypothetical protein EVAR_68124_1 [Eumeta japonica]|uniref:Uncharacterized protein n=1 Tax=Eumeta variegata TaxID=151549 RepID=A0A4C1ZAN8_EUMVA|nr:hypothetical protein EVAR_68124_1 [Eumeta japonica]
MGRFSGGPVVNCPRPPARARPRSANYPPALRRSAFFAVYCADFPSSPLWLSCPLDFIKDRQVAMGKIPGVLPGRRVIIVLGFLEITL